MLLLEMEPEQHNPFPAGPSVFSVSSTRVGWWKSERSPCCAGGYWLLLAALHHLRSYVSYCSCQGQRGRNHCIPLFNWYKRLWIHTQQHKQFTSKKKENQKTRTSVFQLNVFTLHYLSQAVRILQAAPRAHRWGSRVFPSALRGGGCATGWVLWDLVMLSIADICITNAHVTPFFKFAL